MTTLYNHIIARFGLNYRNLYSWEKEGLPYAWVKALAIQGRLYFHEGLWFLEWDGEEFEIDDTLRGQITLEQETRASLRGKPKA